MNGQVFQTKHCGQCVVTNYINHKRIEVTFSQTGFKLFTRKRVLVRSERPRLKDPLARTVFGVGFIGVGPYETHVNGKELMPYGRWKAMIRRCYYTYPDDPKPCYNGVTVCDAWHNYQAYAQWFEENYPDDGGKYDVDKDAKIVGNKVYSPEACSFLSRRDNCGARRLKRGTQYV